jgi:hypothetical protein
MKRSVVSSFIVVLLPFAVFAQAQPQAAPPAGQTVLEPTKFTDQQRWNRAASQFTVMTIALINLGKSKGMSTDEVGTWLGNLFAPGWPTGLTPQQFFQAANRNWMLYPDAIIEVVKATDGEVTYRQSRPYARYFGDNQVSFGVTLAEFERVFELTFKVIAEHVGLAVEQNVDGPWWVVTLRKK